MPNTFPFSVDRQLVTDMANSAKETISCLKSVGARTANIDQFFEVRVHELMQHRPHNVNTDGSDF